MVVVAARRTLIGKRGVSSCPPDYSMEAHGRFRHNNTLNVNQGESFRRTHQVADDHSISGDLVLSTCYPVSRQVPLIGYRGLSISSR